MVEIAKKSECALLALPVQLPFHRYEDDVYKLLENRVPPVPAEFIEPNQQQSQSLKSLTGVSTFDSSAILPPFSPLATKK